MLGRSYSAQKRLSHKLSCALQLAAPADFFVMDAFGCAHRAHASTAGVTQFLRPAVAGLLLEKVCHPGLPHSHVEVCRLAVRCGACTFSAALLQWL